jgi:hypothetical protein
MPELEIKKTPDAIVMIDATATVLIEEPLDGGTLEEFPVDATWL